MIPKFSVIIPVYNAEKHLNRCISSVTNQTYKDFEIILINDGSKDNSGTICDEYAKKYNRIKVIHQENEGVSVARNVGIKNASAEYIIFVDSDDFIETNMLEKLNNVLDKSEAECIIYNLNNIIETKCVSKEDLINSMITLLKTEIVNPPWNKIYKREIIQKFNIQFDKKIEIGEDLLFSMTYISKIKKIYLLNEKLYNYVIENNNSLTKKYKENKYEQLMFVDDELKNILKVYNNKKLLEYEKFVRLKNIFSCFMDLSHKDCKYSKKEKIQFIKKVKKEKKIVIKKLGIKLYMASLLYSAIPAKLLLLISKMVFIRKNKIIS